MSLLEFMRSQEKSQLFNKFLASLLEAKELLANVKHTRGVFFCFVEQKYQKEQIKCRETFSAKSSM